MSSEHLAPVPCQPPVPAHLALVLGRAHRQHSAPEGSEERHTLLQDAVQGAGAAPQVPLPCARPSQGLREKGAGAGAAGAPPSRCTWALAVLSPARQGSASSSPWAGGSLTPASPAGLGAASGLGGHIMHSAQRVWPPAAASPVLPTLYLLSREWTAGQPERRACETHQFSGQGLPLHDVLLQGSVRVQAANNMSPCQSLPLSHQHICPTWLCGTSRAR